jgi:hypothetical protein
VTGVDIVVDRGMKSGACQKRGGGFRNEIGITAARRRARTCDADAPRVRSQASSVHTAMRNYTAGPIRALSAATPVGGNHRLAHLQEARCKSFCADALRSDAGSFQKEMQFVS